MDLLISVVTWLALIQGLSFITYPVLLKVLDERHVAYALSKSLGVFTFGYVAWLLGLTQLIEMTIPELSLLLLGLILLSHSTVKLNWGSWDELPYPEHSALKSIELLFWGSFVFALILYAFHPEIYWGEKPMDLTFLNFFTRNTVLPPQDPWAAGNTMNYYYLGSLLMGLLLKLSGLSSSYGYGLSVSFVASAMVTSSFVGMYALCRSIRWSTIGALAVVFMGTIDAIYLLLAKKFPFGFDLYWATSRTLHTPSINEYPLWSILFADLHAHFIALPLTLCFIGTLILLIQRWIDGDMKSKIPHAVVVGFVWGLLSIVNSWDYITYGITAGLVFGLFAFSPFITSTTAERVSLCGLGLLTLFISIIASLPFHISVSSNAEIGWGYVTQEEFNSLFEVLRIHSHWLVVILVTPFILAKLIRERSSPWDVFGILFFILFASLPISLGLLHRLYLEIPGAPWGVLMMAASISTVGMTLLRLGKRDSLSILGSLLVAIGTIYAIAELYYLMDRMNTTFKVYNALWMLTGVSAVSLIALWVRARPELRWDSATIAPIAPFFMMAFGGTIICIASLLTFQRIPGPRPTLNGSAYLREFNPTEKAAFDWINSHVKGTPVLVEAWGPSYQEYTRFSMHTGLPVVIGWEHHILQRGTPHDDIRARKEDVQTIYSSADPITAIKLLNKYQAELIVVGAMERKAYGTQGLAKFDTNPDLFIPLFSAGIGATEIKLYKTKYSDLKP